MEFALVMGLFFLFCTVVFVFIAIFLPEWVGITGKKAHQVMKEHGAEDAANPGNPAPSPSTEDRHQ